MEIIVDNQRVKTPESTVCNLEEILLKLLSDHVRPGNVVTEVKLNGEVYSEQEPHDAAGIPLSDIKALEISTMGREEIAWHFLENGVQQVDLIIQAGEKVSELFSIADETEANQHYGELLESTHLFLRMVAEVREILNLDFTCIAFENAPVEERLQRLSEVMDQMLQVQEQEDWIMLADLLEYDFVPLLEEWKSILPVLKETKAN